MSLCLNILFCFSNVVQVYDQRRAGNYIDQGHRSIESTKGKNFRRRIIPAMDAEEFKKHFRMRPTTFDSLVSKVEQHLPTPYDGFGKNIIPPKERMYIGIWFFASSEGYRQLATRFGTTESTIHESIEMVLDALAKELNNTVQFPTTEEECQKIASKFQQKNGYPGIVGVIDG